MAIVKEFIKKLDENVVAVVLVVLAVGTRLLPHEANFAAVGAVALFAGVYLKKQQAIILPIGIMIITDLFIGMHKLVFFTWGSFILMGLVGLAVRNRKTVGNVIVGTLTGSFLFYFITNFAVWAYTPMYEKTFNGLMLSYVMALPFFRNSLMGDFFYVGVLFGAYEGARYMISRQVSVSEARSYTK